MIQTVEKCAVGPNGVGVEVMAEGSFVAAAEELAEVADVDAVVAEFEEVVADVVAGDYYHS